MYTWGSDLDGCNITGKEHNNGMLESFPDFGSRHRRTEIKKDSISICMDESKNASTEIVRIHPHNLGLFSFENYPIFYALRQKTL